MFGEKAILKMRRRAAKKLAKTAKACRNFINEKPGRGKKDDFPAVVNGYRIQHMAFNLCLPSNDQAFWDKGFADFAKRFEPILRSLISRVNFALEVHLKKLLLTLPVQREH